MAKSLTYIVSILLLLTGSLSVFAQGVPSVKASVDKNEILIGEPILFSIDVKSPYVSENQLPRFDSIPHFEIIEKPSPDSLISANGASYHLVWKLTSFDSGTRIIPSFSISLGREVFKTDSLAVEVSYGKLDSAVDYHDIKGIIEVENPMAKYIPWAVGAIALIALALVVWWIRQPPTANRQQEEVRVSLRLTPLEEAMAALAELKKMNLGEPAAVKKYYSGLTDTLRVFLNRQLGLVTMEKTSEELIMSLSNQNMERENFSRLTASLRMGDFVKFAKYIPGPYENEENLEVIRSTIVIINETGK
jgi:BatD DUF11 like domain